MTSRDELLTAISELGRLFPEWRMGQMLANLAMSAGHSEPGAVWDLEDGEALAAAQRLIERHHGRQQREKDELLQAIR